MSQRKGKVIVTKENPPHPITTLVTASTKVTEDPNLIPMDINRISHHLTQEQVNEYLDRLEKRQKKFDIKGADKRIVTTHSPFKLNEFGITELDELREIIPTKKNVVVPDMLSSLGKRYERLIEAGKEFGVQPTLPAPKTSNVPARTSRSKRKKNGS